MRRPAISERDLGLRMGVGATGAVLIAAAARAAELGWAQMTAMGAICGAGPLPHCAWCFWAEGLAAAGLFALAAAATPGAKPRRVAAR